MDAEHDPQPGFPKRETRPPADKINRHTYRAIFRTSLSASVTSRKSIVTKSSSLRWTFSDARYWPQAEAKMATPPNRPIHVLESSLSCSKQTRDYRPNRPIFRSSDPIRIESRQCLPSAACPPWRAGEPKHSLMTEEIHQGLCNLHWQGRVLVYRTAIRDRPNLQKINDWRSF